MTLCPRSLFGRLALLLLVVVALALAATICFFRHDRAALLARAVRRHEDRAAAGGARRARGRRRARAARDAAPHRPRIRRAHRARGRAADARRVRARRPRCSELESGCASSWATARSCGSRRGRGLLFVRVDRRRRPATGSAFRCRRGRSRGRAARARSSGACARGGRCLLAAFLFARYLARPLRELNAAVERVGRGEIAAAAAGERPVGDRDAQPRLQPDDREPAPARAGPRAAARRRLARPAHAARAAAARHRDRRRATTATRAGMVADIEEMDRIIGQFLDFARSDDDVGDRAGDANAIVARVRRPLARAGSDVRFAPGACRRCRCGRPRSRASSPT